MRQPFLRSASVAFRDETEPPCSPSLQRRSTWARHEKRSDQAAQATHRYGQGGCQHVHQPRLALRRPGPPHHAFVHDKTELGGGLRSGECLVPEEHYGIPLQKRGRGMSTPWPRVHKASGSGLFFFPVVSHVGVRAEQHLTLCTSRATQTSRTRTTGRNRGGEY